MVAVADELADVVDVIDDGRHGAAGGLRIGRWVVEVDLGIEHELGEDRADDAAALGDGLDHLVAEVALAGDESTAVAVAGVNRPRPVVQKLPEDQVRGVGQVEGDVCCGEGVEQRVGIGVQPAASAGAVAPGIGTKMRQPHRAQALLPPPAYLLRI